jgi:integrase
MRRFDSDPRLHSNNHSVSPAFPSDQDCKRPSKTPVVHQFVHQFSYPRRTQINPGLTLAQSILKSFAKPHNGCIMKKERYRVVRVGNRNNGFYCYDNVTESRKSLRTKDREEAEALVHHKNQAAKNPSLNRKIGMAYLSGSDPKLAERIWQDVMDDVLQDKEGSTLKRWKTALKDEALHLIRQQVVVTTLPDDFKTVLRKGTVSTNVYLRRLQNHCLDMGWLPVVILPRKQFPKIKHKDQRAITWDEHCQIIAREPNPERRDYYELCWCFGGSQSDIANLQAEDFDYKRRAFAYNRCKNSNLGGSRIGPKAWTVILRRPRSGPLFPYLITVRESDRATEFKERCDGLRIKGVTLHNYRYAWAERSADNGYPERYAQRVLGQNSKIVHQAYAKKAQKQLPSLEEYEEATRRAEKKGKVVVMEHEAELPKLR